MGTQLLFIDITISAELLLKQLRGHKVTRRERNKLKRTLNDITSLVPVTILMLLPVSNNLTVFSFLRLPSIFIYLHDIDLPKQKNIDGIAAT